MKSESGNKNIFSSSHHFTRDELIRYHHHAMSDDELHSMQMHLVDCELCSDALNGVAELANASLLIDAGNDLRRRARRKNLLKKNIFSHNELIAILAVVFLILFLLLMSIFFFAEKGTKKIPVGVNNTEQNK